MLYDNLPDISNNLSHFTVSKQVGKKDKSFIMYCRMVIIGLENTFIKSKEYCFEVDKTGVTSNNHWCIPAKSQSLGVSLTLFEIRYDLTLDISK